MRHLKLIQTFYSQIWFKMWFKNYFEKTLVWISSLGFFLCTKLNSFKTFLTTKNPKKQNMLNMLEHKLESLIWSLAIYNVDV